MEDRVSAACASRGLLLFRQPGRFPCQSHLRTQCAAYDCVRAHANVPPRALYFPYVISLYPRLVWESLRPGHQTLFSKGTSNVTKFKPLCALRRAEMYHPVKRQCAAALEGYSLRNLAYAQNSRTLQTTSPIGERAASCATAGDRSRALATTAPVGCTTRTPSAT